MREHIVERAWKLAGSGRFNSLRDLELHLRQSGYDGTELSHLRSPSLKKDLTRLFREGAPSSAVPGGSARDVQSDQDRDHDDGSRRGNHDDGIETAAAHPGT